MDKEFEEFYKNHKWYDNSLPMNEYTALFWSASKQHWLDKAVEALDEMPAYSDKYEAVDLIKELKE